MKYLNLLVCVILTSSAASVFASERPEFMQFIQGRHRLINNGVYDIHSVHDAYAKIGAVAIIPEHMQTTQIKPCVALAIALQIKINNGKNMFDEDIQDDAKKLYAQGRDIRNLQEYDAYDNARKNDIYTETDLVALEQQRIQEEQHQAHQIAAEKAGCYCTIS